MTGVSALDTTAINNICIVQTVIVDFTGDECQCAIDYCSEKNNICKNGGSCSMMPTGGFVCSCQPGELLQHLYITSCVLLLLSHTTNYIGSAWLQRDLIV